MCTGEISEKLFGAVGVRPNANEDQRAAVVATRHATLYCAGGGGEEEEERTVRSAGLVSGDVLTFVPLSSTSSLESLSRATCDVATTYNWMLDRLNSQLADILQRRLHPHDLGEISNILRDGYGVQAFRVSFFFFSFRVCVFTH